MGEAEIKTNRVTYVLNDASCHIFFEDYRLTIKCVIDRQYVGTALETTLKIKQNL